MLSNNRTQYSADPRSNLLDAKYAKRKVVGKKTVWSEDQWTEEPRVRQIS